MSYILGALKKAEKERARDRGVQLDSWSDEQWDEPEVARSQGKGLMIAVVVVILLLFAMVLMLAFQLTLTTKTSVSGDEQSIQGVSVETQDDLERISPPNLSESSSEESGSGQTGVREEQSDLTTPDTKNLVVQDTAVEGSDENSTSLENNEIPTFTGHMYFPTNKSLSRVFANSRSYREGDSIGRYTIESIEEGSVFLRSNEVLKGTLESGDQEEALIEVSLN